MTTITNLNGTSNTVLVGEKSLDTSYYNNTSSSGWDECIFSGGYGGTTRTSNVLFRDSSDGSAQGNYWGAAHPAGAQFVMCDGSVRTINYTFSGTAAFQDALTWSNTDPFNLD
jgi:prepilin-type processing-associated H-X9-DG protein